MASKFVAFRASEEDRDTIADIQREYDRDWHKVTISEAIRIALRLWDNYSIDKDLDAIEAEASHE